MANAASYFKMDDQWLTDPKIRALIKGGHYDSVTLFYGLVAYSHSHNLDGVLKWQEVCTVVDLCMLPGWNPYGTRLSHRSLVNVTRGRTLIIAAYSKWQTTADQRKEWRDSKRIPRGMNADSGRKGEERKGEVGTGARGASRSTDDSAAAASPPGDDGRIRDWSRPGPAVYVDNDGKRAMGPAMRRIFASEPEE